VFFLAAAEQTIKESIHRLSFALLEKLEA